MTVALKTRQHQQRLEAARSAQADARDDESGLGTRCGILMVYKTIQALTERTQETPKGVLICVDHFSPYSRRWKSSSILTLAPLWDMVHRAIRQWVAAGQECTHRHNHGCPADDTCLTQPTATAPVSRTASTSMVVTLPSVPGPSCA